MRRQAAGRPRHRGGPAAAHIAAELKAAGATEIFPDLMAIHRRLAEREESCPL